MPRDDDESLATVQAALNAGLTFLDTADFYGMGHNETLLGRAIKGRRDQAFLRREVRRDVLAHRRLPWRGRATEFGQELRVPLASAPGHGRFDHYQPGRPDPAVPYEDTIGAVADLIKEGKVRYLGVSEAGAENLRWAHAVHPVTALEIEYSLACRFIEREILPTARELASSLTACWPAASSAGR